MYEENCMSYRGMDQIEIFFNFSFIIYLFLFFLQKWLDYFHYSNIQLLL